MRWWLLSLVACTGRIADPEAFIDASKAFQCDAPERTYEDIVRPRCLSSGCHASAFPAAALDLEAAKPFDRLFGVSAFGCRDQVLLDTKTPFAGYLFDKLHDEPACGERMPLGQPPLSDSERACLHLWLSPVLETP